MFTYDISAAKQRLKKTDRADMKSRNTVNNLQRFLISGDRWQLTAMRNEGMEEEEAVFSEVRRVWRSFGKRKRGRAARATLAAGVCEVGDRRRDCGLSTANYIHPPAPLPCHALLRLHALHTARRLQAPRSHAAPHATRLFCCC